MENPANFIPVFKTFLSELSSDFDAVFLKYFDGYESNQCYYIVPDQVAELIKLIYDHLSANPPKKPTGWDDQNEYNAWHEIYRNMQGLQVALERKNECTEASKKFELIKGDNDALLKWVLEYLPLGKELIVFSHEIEGRTDEYISQHRFENELYYLRISSYWNLLISREYFKEVSRFTLEHIRYYNHFAIKFLGDEFDENTFFHEYEYYPFDLVGHLAKND